MVVYDRINKNYVLEKDYRGSTLDFLYTNILGKILLKLVVSRPYFSKIAGLYKKSKLSKQDIKPFIEEYNIDVSDYDIDKMESFNDFFTRQRKVDIEYGRKNELVAVADSKLAVYKITDDLKLNIKGNTYTLEELLHNKDITEEFKGGYALVFRLSVDDYHRYHHFDFGCITKQYEVKGELHTIRPISKEYKVYKRNHRILNEMHTFNFGKIIYIEVGATLVGSIKNNEHKVFRKLQEKGYFEYGGSTIVILLKDIVDIDKDIMIQSQLLKETIVKIGDKIGTLKER